MPRKGREAARLNQKRHDDALRIVGQFLTLAVEDGLEPHITNWGAGGSVYVKFADPRLGSLRIADHRGKRDREDLSKERYKYRWNLRGDIERHIVIVDENIKRFFYGWHEIPQMVETMRQYLEAIKLRDTVSKRQLGLWDEEELNGPQQENKTVTRDPPDRDGVGDSVRCCDSDWPTASSRDPEKGIPGEQEGSEKGPARTSLPDEGRTSLQGNPH